MKLKAPEPIEILRNIKEEYKIRDYKKIITAMHNSSKNDHKMCDAACALLKEIIGQAEYDEFMNSLN